MKNLLFTLALLFTIISKGQISLEKSNSFKVGVAKNFDITIAAMYKTNDIPTYYFIDFNNIESGTVEDMTSFGFYDVDGAFEILYNSVIQGFKDKSESIVLKIGNGSLKVEYGKYTLGRFRFIFTDASGLEDSSDFITKKQFSKLFGKKFNKADFKN